MSTHVQDFLVANAAVAVAMGLSWGWGRAIRRGRPLTLRMRAVFLYSFLFALGMAYTMMLGSWFGWPHRVWFGLIAAWGVALALIAWLRHRRKQGGTPGVPAPPLDASDPLDLRRNDRPDS